MRRVGASVVATVVIPSVVIPTNIIPSVVIPTSGKDRCARRHSGRTIVRIVIAAVPVVFAREPVVSTSIIATSSKQLTSDGSRRCLSPTSADVVVCPAEVALDVIFSQLYGAHLRC